MSWKTAFADLRHETRALLDVPAVPAIPGKKATSDPGHIKNHHFCERCHRHGHVDVVPERRRGFSHDWGWWLDVARPASSNGKFTNSKRLDSIWLVSIPLPVTVDDDGW